MKAYVLSILGIVVVGVLIDVIIPSGSTGKYVKSIFSIFVVAVIISPVINLIAKAKGLEFSYKEISINSSFVEYVLNKQVDEIEFKIESLIEDEGIYNVEVELNHSVEFDKIKYNSCAINLENMVLKSDKSHNNIYEIIKKIVNSETGLTEEEILFYE